MTKVIVLSNQGLSTQDLNELAKNLHCEVKHIEVKTFPELEARYQMKVTAEIGFEGEGPLAFLSESCIVIIIEPISIEGVILRDVANQKYVNWRPKTDPHGHVLPGEEPSFGVVIMAYKNAKKSLILHLN